jgi:hypothetical protein
MTKICLAGVTLAFCTAVAFAQTPSLAGIWHWNPSKSSQQQGPNRPEDMFLNIDQSGSDLTFKNRVRARGDEQNETYRFKIGGDESRNEMNGAATRSTAKWDGSTLVITSLSTMNGREARVEDRYTLSPDGKTLTMVESRQMGTNQPMQATVVFDKQEGSTWEPDRPPKKMEEIYKNIQVLNGVPANRLRPIMQNFNRSLGVECNHCHVQGQFPSDDKPQKTTARNMLKMVHNINQANFNGNMEVSCWTCHRGAAKPQTSPDQATQAQR